MILPRLPGRPMKASKIGVLTPQAASGNSVAGGVPGVPESPEDVAGFEQAQLDAYAEEERT